MAKNGERHGKQLDEERHESTRPTRRENNWDLNQRDKHEAVDVSHGAAVILSQINSFSAIKACTCANPRLLYFQNGNNSFIHR